MRIKHLISPVRVPYWKEKGFGLNLKHFEEADAVTVTCSYKQSDGTLLYPHKYFITSQKVRESGYNTMKPDLVIIPVSEFQIYNPEEHK